MWTDVWMVGDTDMAKLNNVSFSRMFSECTTRDMMKQGTYQYWKV